MYAPKTYGYLEAAARASAEDLSDLAVDKAIEAARSMLPKDVFYVDVLAQKMRAALLDSIPGATNADLPAIRKNYTHLKTRSLSLFLKYRRTCRWLNRFAPHIKTI